MSVLSKSRATYAPRVQFFGLGALLELWRQRQHLAQLDAHALKDLGLTEAQAKREATRPLWDVPAHWLS